MRCILDIRTVIVFDAMVMSVIGLVMILYIYKHKTYPGFLLWTIASFVIAGGQLLVAFRESLPVFISVVLSNFLIGAGLFLLKIGLVTFFIKRNTQVFKVFVPDLLLFIFYFIALTLFSHTIPSIFARLSVIAIYFSYLMFSMGFISNRGVRAIFGYPYILVSCILFCSGTVLILHGFLNYFTNLYLENYFSLKAPMSFSTAINFSLLIALLISLVSLNNHRVSFDLERARKKINRQHEKMVHVNNDLLNALSEIRTLHGILPICSNCKKIRNDQGYWDQLEKYLSEHTEVMLSHGLCPDCLQREYPEIYEEMKRDGKLV